MEASNCRRQRATRLTEEALELLNSQLLRLWRDLGEEGRLTRVARAALMEVSINTADRVLRRSGNDKAILSGVFRAVQLEWKDEYCEHVAIPEKIPNSPDAPSETASARPTVFRRKSWMIAVATSVAMLFGLIYLAENGRANSTQPTVQQAQIANRLLNFGRDAYIGADYAKARQHADSAIQIGLATKLANILAEALRLKADALAAQGHLEEALACYERALPLWSSFEIADRLGTLYEVMGVTYARLGRLDEAERCFQSSLQVLRRVPPHIDHAGSLRGLGSIEAIRGSHANAQKRYEATLSNVDPKADPGTVADIRALRALVLRDSGEYEEALIELRKCLSFWRAQNHPRWIATTLRQIASVQICAGDEVSARKNLNQAMRRFREVGDLAGVQGCETMLSEGQPYVQSLEGLVEDYF